MIEGIAAMTMCLALNVYHEARGEPEFGQVAVAYVTVNRAMAKKKTVCAVVVAPKQFSWTNDGIVRLRHGWKLKESMHPKDMAAWERAWQVADHALRNPKADPTGGATHYHAIRVWPKWSSHFEMLAVVGQHAFYR